MLYNLIFQQDLTEGQRAIVFEYYYLLAQARLSCDQLRRLSKIWEKAEDDLMLSQALTFVDSCVELGEDTQKLLEDKDLRVFLSEYVPVIAKAKLNRTEGKQENLASSGYITLLCPDASGFTIISLKSDEFISLTDLLERTCNNCGLKLSDHKGLCHMNIHQGSDTPASGESL